MAASFVLDKDTVGTDYSLLFFNMQNIKYFGDLTTDIRICKSRKKQYGRRLNIS